jgi:fucose permease
MFSGAEWYGLVGKTIIASNGGIRVRIKLWKSARGSGSNATELVPSQHLALLPPGVLHSFILVTGLFFLWGIPSNLNDVLIRQFMKSFEISRFQGGLVQSAFYMGYFLLALPLVSQ